LSDKTLDNNRDVLLEFSMTPLDKGESVSNYVSRSLDIIDNSGIPYRINPMGTCVEGTWDEVMQILKDCYDKMKEDCNRISVNIKIDYRKNKTNRLSSKIKSIEDKLGRKIKS